jgi:hypothetical protein
VTEAPDVVSALLYVAQNTDPFQSSYIGNGADLYTAVKFVRGYPLGETETPTVALEVTSGPNRPTGLGTVRQYRRPTIVVHVLTETEMESQRIVEWLRQAWQADFDVDAGAGTGAVGDGYLRLTGNVGYVWFSESQIAPWDEAGRINRRIFNVEVFFADS